MLIPVRDWWCPIVFFFIQVCFYYTGSVFRIIVIWKNEAVVKKVHSRWYCTVDQYMYFPVCINPLILTRSPKPQAEIHPQDITSTAFHTFYSSPSLPVTSFLHIGVRKLSPFTLSMNLQHMVYLNCTGFFLRKTPLSFSLYLMLIYREIWMWLYVDCIQRFGCTDTRKVAKKNISQDLQ